MTLVPNSALLAALLDIADEGAGHPTSTALELLLFDRGIDPHGAGLMSGQRAAAYLRSPEPPHLMVAAAWLEGLVLGVDIAKTAAQDDTTTTQEDA